MGYEIRVVSHDEFDALPYKKAKKSLGLADPKTNVAYVRNTGVKDLDEMTINHEFDELLMKVSPHEEDGIRYKAWLPWLASVALAAGKSAAIGAGVGGISSKARGGSFWKGAGQGAKWGAIGSGAGSLFGSAGGALGAKGGVLGKIGGGLTKVGSMLGGYTGSSNPGLTGGAKSGFAPGGPTELSLPKQPGAVYNAGAIVNQAPKGASLSSKFGGFLQDVGKKAFSGSGGDILSSFGTSQPLTGGNAISGYGGAGAINRFAPSLQAGGNFNMPTQEEYETGISSINKAKEQRLFDVFNTGAFRGQNINENTALAGAVSNVNKGFENELSAYNTEFEGLPGRREYDAVAAANQIGPDKMDELIKLAQGPDEAITALYGNDPNEFRSIFKHLPLRLG